MIVRILTEGQFRLSGSQLDRLNRLDNQVVAAVQKGNEAQFQKTFAQLLDLVRQKGQPVPLQEFVESDVVLPQPNLTLGEAKRLFVGEGLIPG